jgi:hypothetical protein
MRKRILFILVACSVLVFSCKKKKIETLPQSNDPIFYLDGTFGNSSVNYVAGNQAMTMKHGVEARNGVDYAYGELTDGITSIKLGIFDGHLSIDNYVGNLKIGDSLSMANKFTNILANLSKGNFSNDGNISNVDWYVNGLFRGSNQVNISQPGVYDVCGNFTFADDGSQKSICNKMFLGFEEDVIFSIKHFLSENGDVKLWVEGTTQYFDSVVWKIDNQIIASGISHSTNIGNEERTITAKVYHQNGGVREKSIVIDGTFSGHFIEDFVVCEMPNNQPKWDNKIGLEVKIDGEEYSSFEVANNKSKVVVKDIKLHEINAQGNEVIRINVEVDAMLKSLSTGLSKPMKFNAVFAYPVPN